MARYRQALPQLEGAIFLTDGGLETHLVFQEGKELPCFAAFPLLATEEGREQMARYFAPYLRIAGERGAGFILDTPTWRANPDWGSKLGYDAEGLAAVNRDAVAFAAALRDEAPAGAAAPIVINGVLGPRGDGYRADARMSAVEAERYHAAQIETFADTEADMVSALTMTYVEEAIGIARAARQAGLPAVISFTVETDGRLPAGTALPDAIAAVDAATGGAPAYYMINCAHPTHFADTLGPGGAWQARLRGLRANASTRSHAELDAATELDAGDPAALGQQYRVLRGTLPGITVLGGCCGTDHRHVRAICEACLPD
ncbi:MAG: homocysteine S-methyltransferase family protein [Alphaproteobacteria bacterium]|nr:homocysteine S-methyltransferase family protein [Alphaproteobacteria bacterium]